MNTIYIDNTLITSLSDKKLRTETLLFLEEFKSGKAILIISELLHSALQSADQEVKDLFDKIPADNIRECFITEDSMKLETQYRMFSANNQIAFFDALHTAMATLNNADMLISWNYDMPVFNGNKDSFSLVNDFHKRKKIKFISPYYYNRFEKNFTVVHDVIRKQVSIW